MIDKKLPLLDIFPFNSAPHGEQSKAIAKALNEKLEPSVTYANPRQLVEEILRHDGGGDPRSASRLATDNSEIYREWQNSMPYLMDVPNISAYRQSSSMYYTLDKLEEEIIKHGRLLRKGQILYRGGTTNQAQIRRSTPLSTSTLPSVAWSHAAKTAGNISILNIATDLRVKAFAFRTKGNQKLKQEYEILLQSHVVLTKTETHKLGDKLFYEYDLTI